MESHELQAGQHGVASCLACGKPWPKCKVTHRERNLFSASAKPFCLPPLACYKTRILCLEVSASRCDCNCHGSCNSQFVSYCLSFTGTLHSWLSQMLLLCGKSARSHCKFKLTSLSPFNVLASPCLATFRNCSFRKHLGTSIFICCVYMQLPFVCRLEDSACWIHFPDPDPLQFIRIQHLMWA